jgi:hypothetical protein
MSDDLHKRHMQAWGRAAQLARHCIEMKQQRCDTNDSAFRTASEALLAELVTLVDLSQELDNTSPVWRRGDIYMTGAKAMLSACGVSLQEIDAYQNRSVDGDIVGIS